MAARRCPFAVVSTMLEVETRWGDTLLEVVLVGRRQGHAIAGTEVVRAGTLVGAADGQIGHVVYAIRGAVAAARTVPYTRGDARAWAYVATALAVHLAIWAAMPSAATPPRVRSSSGARPRPVHVSHAFAHAEEQAPLPTHGGQGTAEGGPAGAAATPAVPRPRGRVTVQNTGDEAQLSRTEQVAQARRAGILGSTATIAEAYVALRGPDQITSGFDGASTNSPLTDGDLAAHGDFGGARSGTGDGGGGAWGTIGVGTSGHYSSDTTFGHGSSAAVEPTTWHEPWQGGDYRYTSLPHHPRATPGTTVEICAGADRARCAVTGALEDAVIRRYVRRERARLAYCYEKTLLATPTLPSGPVLVSFTVLMDGHVAAVTATGLHDDVSSCTAAVFEHAQLPRAPEPTSVSYAVSFRHGR